MQCDGRRDECEAQNHGDEGRWMENCLTTLIVAQCRQKAYADVGNDVEDVEMGETSNTSSK